MATAAFAQSPPSPQAPIVNLSLNPDQIATVKTAQGITTRISFPEEVKEIICGDLYDPTTGKGAFVVQRSDNDIFLKPLQTKGITNLFVKTGDKGQRVYNFDLTIVSASEAHRVVNVGTPPGQQQPKNEKPADSSPEIIARAREQADEILKDARRQSQQMISDAEQQASTINRQAMDKAASVERLAMQHAEEIGKKFVYAMMNGLQETKVDNQRVSTKNIVITLNPKVITFDGKSYLSFSILNSGAKEFAFAAISLEAGTTDKNKQPIAAEIVQSKSDNILASGETLKGVVVFDPALVKETDRLIMYLRGQDNVEIARANIR
jgi:type IV secretory pathway VirB9-like protein